MEVPLFCVPVGTEIPSDAIKLSSKSNPTSKSLNHYILKIQSSTTATTVDATVIKTQYVAYNKNYYTQDCQNHYLVR